MRSADPASGVVTRAVGLSDVDVGRRPAWAGVGRRGVARGEAVQAIDQLIASSLLALIGLVASAVVLRAIPGSKQRSATFAAAFAGAACIVAAPILLAIG
jgi:hypothetical protein